MNYVYTIMVSVPLPKLGIGIFGGIFPPTVPRLIKAITPKSVTWLLTKASTTLAKAIDTAQKLVLAIPGITVRIVVKIGGIPVINVQLMAKPVPVAVPLPSLKISLPSLSYMIHEQISLGGLAPIVIYVPVPVPLVTPPHLSVTLPQINAGASAGVDVNGNPIAAGGAGGHAG